MNVPELLNELHIPFKEQGEHHHATSRYVQIDCPWCSPGAGHFRMGIRRDGWKATCWVCGPHRVKDTLVEASGIASTRLSHLLIGLSPPNDFEEKVG